MSNRNIIVISGPSGSGKTTLINRLIENHPEIIFSTSHTTRSIRANEVDGKDYHFVSREQFFAMRDRGEFAEWADVYGYYYGTGYAEIEAKSTPGGNTILALDIDVQGADQIKKKYPGALFIFIVPPSLEILKQRLEAREKKFDQHLQKRLEIAKEELKQYRRYNYIVINDDLEEAVKVLEAIYTAYRHTSRRQEAFMKEYLSGGKGYGHEPQNF